jgi:hypothetical protein
MGPGPAFKGSVLEQRSSQANVLLLRKPQTWSAAKDLNLYTRGRSLLRRVRLPFRQQRINFMRFADTAKREQFLFVFRGNLVLNQRVELRTPPSSGVRSTDELDQDKLFKQSVVP